MSYTVTVASTPNKTHRGATKPIYLVLHQTVGSFDSAFSWLQNPAAEASAEEVISRDGKRVGVLIRTAEDCYAWAVGNGNPYCGANFEGEWLNSSTPFTDAFYPTLAARIKTRKAQIKNQFGVDIPLRMSRFKGDPGIVRHGTLAKWYGGSDHYSCGTAYDITKVLAALNGTAVQAVTIKTGGGKAFHLKGKRLAKRTAARVRTLLQKGRDKLTITRS